MTMEELFKLPDGALVRFKMHRKELYGIIINTRGQLPKVSYEDGKVAVVASVKQSQWLTRIET